MAKKKKKKEEEKYEFKLPEFDEKEFLEKEIRDAKLTFVTIGYALVMVFVTYFLAQIDFKLGFFIAIFGMAFFKKIYEIVGFDTSKFEKKNWAGSGAIYFFTWLSLWILVSNPPITDNASPHISDIMYARDITNETISIGDNVTIWANVTDNSKVKNVDITIFLNNKTIYKSESMKKVKNEKNQYLFTIKNASSGKYKFEIIARDKNGNLGTKKGGFSVPGIAKLD